MVGENFTLPLVREDIELMEGPKTIDGFPTWNLYDPVRNTYFRIGWLEFNLLSAWPLGKSKPVVDTVNQTTTLSIANKHVLTFIGFLQNNNLLQIPAGKAASQLLAMHDKANRFSLMKLLPKYLFIKLNILKPDKFLEKTLPYVTFLFHKRFYIVLLMLALVSVYLVSRQWEEFIHTFWYFFNLTGLIYLIITVLVVKIIHELAHAYTAKYFGIRVTAIGFALIVIWPILYTDTTEAWRLTSRYQRMAIDAAGMISELILAVFATFLWVLFPDGALRTAMFFVATTSWMMSILINLNPFIRFDGYYLLGDTLDVSNLQRRAFSLCKWRLREWLFHFNEIKPEFFSKKMEKILLVYGYSTWFYRILIFTAISVFIYHFFFKLLGTILLILIFLNFILLPIIRELREIWRRREAITMNKSTIRTCILLAFLLIILVLPWSSSIHAPALLKFGQETRIYTHEAGIVESVSVKDNELVTANQLLLVMRSPELEHELQQTQHDIDILHRRIKAEAFDASRLGHRQADAKELASKKSQYDALKAKQAYLTITAPFTGEISYVVTGLKPNLWLPKNDYILELINDSSQQINVYVPEKEVTRIKPDSLVTFYPSEPNLPKVEANIVNIERANTKELNDNYLASVYGGDIAVEKDNQERLLVKNTIYRLTLEPVTVSKAYKHATTGTAVLTGKRISLLHRAWIRINAVLIRESGF